MNNFYGDNIRWWYGTVVNVDQDPLQLGRALVRIFGVHGEEIPDNELPWASVVLPTTSGGISGIGTNPQLMPGAKVFGFFVDGKNSQVPLIFGSIPVVEGFVPERGGTGSPVPGFTGQSNSVDGSARSLAAVDPNYIAPGYPSDLSQGEIEDWIRQEAELRGIDPRAAILIYRHEGRGSYQSGIPRTGNGSRGGREASYGPYQLYVGGGLGNTYERNTGRDLTTDNTRDGIRNQIRFALDQAATGSGGWGPWYGRGPAGVSQFEGLDGARAVRNWN
jgi:hypothetical protein